MRKVSLIAGVLMTIGLPGCETPQRRINAPPHGYTDRRHPMTQIYDDMTGNALAVDTRVCDYHFKPSAPILNDTGRLALERIAQAIAEDGGRVYYQSASAGPDLYTARVAAIKRYLVDEAGLAEDSTEVVNGYAATPQMEGAEAVAILNNARKAMSGDTKGGKQTPSLGGGSGG